jgi:L-alanine-DL-glutamate epimerase-like enolase superfamily enzyme
VTDADDSEDTRISQSGGVPWRDLHVSETHRPPERDVEITGIRSMAVAGNFTWGIVRIDTNTDHYGIGETHRAPRGLLEFAEGLEHDLVGENPLDVDRLTELFNQSYTNCGRIGQGAWTGIEMALWDLKGKLLDVPVYELLGGKYRDRVRIYNDTHAGEGLGKAEAGSVDPRDIYTPESYARAAREVVEEGFEALKFDLDVHTDPTVDTAARRLDNEAIAHKVSLVEAVREEIGYDVDLGVDLHWNFTVETAVRLARKLEPYDLAWIEDPVHPEKLEAQRQVRERTTTPILTGEQIHGTGDFKALLDEELLDIAAPDVTHCGGLRVMREVATLCDLHGVPVAPHNVSSPLGTVAGAHVAASIPNHLCMEYHAREIPWWDDMVDRTGGSGPILEDGYVDLPEGPGLGVELDPEVVERHLVEGHGSIV